MSRPLASVVVLVALSALAGCAGSGQNAAVAHSLASQVPTEPIAAAPPTDFEFDFTPKETTKAAKKDARLTSLHAASPTRTDDE